MSRPKSDTAAGFIEPPSADRPRIMSCTLTGTQKDGATAALHLSGGESSMAKVTCYFGTDVESWTSCGSWTHESDEADYSYTTTGELDFGTTYYSAFKLEYEAEGEEVTVWTETQRITFAGIDFWRNGTEDPTDWFTESNWSLERVPNEQLSVVFSNVTAKIEVEDRDLVTRTLLAKNSGYATIALNGNSTFTTPNNIVVGSSSTSRSYPGSVTMTGGVATVGGYVSIPTYGTRCTNAHLDLIGTKMTVAGSLTVSSDNDSGNNNYLSIKGGAELSVADVTISYGNAVYVNNATLINRGSLTLAHNAKSGTLELSNGSVFNQLGTASLGGKGTATMKVSGGSAFNCATSAFYLGGLGDGGDQSSTVTIADSTFLAKSVAMPRSSNYTGVQKMNVSGAESRITVTEGFRIGVSGRASGSSIVNLNAGTMTIGGELTIGADARPSRFNVQGAEANVTASAITYHQKASSTLTVPEEGFKNPVFTATGNILFPATLDTPITIDATACKVGTWQTLFKSTGGEIKNYSNAKITVSGTYKNRESQLRVVTDEEEKVTAVQFRVKGGGLVLILK